MPIANCKRCGRIYNKLGRDICPSCIKEEDDMLHEIRGFLKKHKEANIHEVAEGTGAEYGVIINMIRDGRVILRDNPNINYPCERCGNPTQSGRFCAKCTKEIAQTFSDAGAQVRERNQKKNQGSGFYSRL